MRILIYLIPAALIDIIVSVVLVLRAPSVDALLGTRLVHVFQEILDRQTELDADAKNILYGSKRTLYRR